MNDAGRQCKKHTALTSGIGLMVFSLVIGVSRRTSFAVRYREHHSLHHDPPDAFQVCFVLILSTMTLIFLPDSAAARVKSTA